MQMETDLTGAEVFVSYSSSEHERVLEIAGHLESAGARMWIDRHKIDGGMTYGPEIVHGIRECKVLMLMCSDAAMRSRNVKQEILLAWKYELPYLPVLLEPVSFPEQLQYWLEGCQWIEVLDFPPAQWMPSVLRALAHAGVHLRDASLSPYQAESASELIRPDHGLHGLRSVAKFTDQIWPLSADRVRADADRPALRGLGAPQDNVQHGHRLGSRVCLAIESEAEGNLLLLDEGPEGIIYSLCPSHFAPDTRLLSGRSYLPQAGSRYDSFVITGKPGREHLLAIITDQPLKLDWTPEESRIPARVLSQTDIDTLLAQLRALEGNRWTALSTYFDVIA